MNNRQKETLSLTGTGTDLGPAMLNREGGFSI